MGQSNVISESMGYQWAELDTTLDYASTAQFSIHNRYANYAD